MYKNGFSCKKSLYSYNIRYLTPCEILTEYLNEPCSIFCGTVIPTGGNGIVSPMPPLPPIINMEPFLKVGRYLEVEITFPLLPH